MALQFDDEEYSSKIPYDSEPISRNTKNNQFKDAQKKKDPNASNKNKFNIFFMAICMVLIIAIAVLYGQVKQVQKARNNYNINIEQKGVNLTYAATKGMLSTVCVAANTANNISDETTFFRGSKSQGSGVILSVDKDAGDMYVITNYHVLANVETRVYYGYYYIMLWDGETPIPASCVGGNYLYDIAVLKVTGSSQVKLSSCQAVEVADTQDVVMGESCLTIGNSMGMNLRISNGIVSVEEVLNAKTETFTSIFLSFSAAVNSGNSGGGLYDSRGNLIGIVDAKFDDVNSSTGTLRYNEVVHGMFYAIPSNIAVGVAKNIIRNNGTLRKADIGLTYGETYDYTSKSIETNEETGGQTQYKSIMLTTSGKFKANDIIESFSYEFGGKTINVTCDHISSIEGHIFNWSIGDTITFNVTDSYGANRSFDVTVNYYE